MHPIVPWLPLLLVPVLAAFLGLISFLLAQMGWSRLAGAYAGGKMPATVESKLLNFLRIGPVKYTNAAWAGFTAQGVWLTTWRILYIGHPPLFIPWSAFGPVQEETFLWTKIYTTYVVCRGESVRFQFSSSQLYAALLPHVG